MSVSISLISKAARNTATLLNANLEVPPVKMRVIQSPIYSEEPALVEPIHPKRKTTIFEIWKLYLIDKTTDENIEAYILISGDYSISGYELGDWDNLEYHGFYTTIDEAENYIGLK